MKSDEDAGTFTPPVAAIPSRAAQSPESVMANRPLPPVKPAAPKARRKRAKKPAHKRQTPPKHSLQRLAPAEIKKINRNRRKNVAKRAKIKAAPKPAKNPNRPLEMKNKLHAVLKIVASLNKQESACFANAMQVLEDMPRSGRKHVIAALGQVYG
jgi:hypothetical protein